MLDAFRGYVQLANGLSDVTRQRAVQAARQLVDHSGGFIVGVASSAGSAEVARQVQGLAEDILATSRTNRDLLVGLIRTEVDRAVGRLGLVGADELSAMARVVERLQNQLDAAIAFGARATGGGNGDDSGDDDSSSGPRTSDGPARKSARPEPVRFAEPGARTAPGAKPGTKKVAVKSAAGQKPPARNVAAKKAAPKKAAPKKTVPKQAAGQHSAGPAAHAAGHDHAPSPSGESADAGTVAERTVSEGPAAGAQEPQ